MDFGDIFGGGDGGGFNPVAAVGLSGQLGFLGPAMSYYGASQANARNQANQDSMNAWQTMMSNTAHQREVWDLRAAGLNPILSANSGASVPSGQMATFQNELSQAADMVQEAPGKLADIAQKGMAMQQTTADIQNTNADTQLKAVQGQAASAQALASRSQAMAAQENAKNTALDTLIRSKTADSEVQSAAYRGAKSQLDQKTMYIDKGLDMFGEAVGAWSSAKGAGRFGTPAPGAPQSGGRWVPYPQDFKKYQGK